MQSVRKIFVIKIAVIILLFLLLVGCSVFKRDKSTESSFNQNTTQVVYKTEYDESLLKNNIPEQKIEKFIEVNKKEKLRKVQIVK